MVKVKFLQSKDKFISFEIKGHAGLSAYGTDIVCAAISSTSILVLNGLIEVMGLDVKYKVDEGYINCEIKENEYEKAQYLIKSLYIYLVELEKQYPKNLKIKIMEV